MDFSYQELILTCLAALLAGFVDSIVGGGGLVQVPTLFILFPHFQVPQIIATNRFSSFMGTAVAGYQYSKKVKIPYKTVLYAAIGAGTMSFIGAKLASLMDAQILKPIIFILILVIAVFTYRNKDFGQEEKHHALPAKIPIYGFLIGFCTGFYNGMVGPGTGSLLVFGFVGIIGFSFLKASAVAKIINVIADIFSLIFFVINGFVVYKLAIPMMICNIIGSYTGSKMAILKGNEFIRSFFLVVIFGLILRFGWDVLKMYLK